MASLTEPDYPNEPNEVVQRVVRALADGTDVDWAEVSGGQDDTDGRVLGQLRVLANLAAVHRVDLDNDGTPEWWGHLRLIQQVGRGAFGTVYSAWDSRLDRDVALKLTRVRSAGHRAPESTFIEEARLLAKVRHPNVVTVYGADRIDGQNGLWTEFIRGRTMADIVDHDGPLDSGEAARVGVDLCRGLGAIHCAGLLHRDVKAQNVMRENGGRIVLMDLGAGIEHQRADQGALHGTPLYLAPEVLAGHAATSRSDVYSVGVLLYYLVSGAFPVTGDRLEGMRDAHASGQALPVGAHRTDLPSNLAKVIGRAIEKSPDKRFQTAAELETALARCLSSSARRRLTLLGASAVVALTLIGLAWQSRTDRAVQDARDISTTSLPTAVPPTSSSAQPPVIPVSEPASPISTRPAFGPEDTIMFAAFEDRTGTAGLAATLDRAMRVAAQSSAIPIASAERIRGLLQRMRLPGTTRITKDVARDVAMRDGSIHHVARGWVERANDGFGVFVTIIESSSGAALVTKGDWHRDPTVLADITARLTSSAIDSLGNKVGTALATRPLEPVTAVSLEAARLLTLAVDAAADNGHKTTLELTTRALEIEPGLPAAEALRALALQGLRAPPAEYRAAAKRAAANLDGLQPWELHWIRGIEASLSGELDQLDTVIDEYSKVMTLRPDFYLGVVQLKLAAAGAWMPDRAAPFLATAARMRPTHFKLNLFAVEALTSLTPNLDGASAAARRALNSVGDSRDSGHTAFIRFFPAFEAWARGDVRAASLRADEALSALAVAGPLSQESGSRFAAMFALTVGRLAQARALIDRVPEAGGWPRAPMIGLWAHERGDFDTARSVLLGQFRNTRFAGMGRDVNFWLFARVGGAQALSSEELPSLPTDEIFLAERALQAGRPEEAIAPFENVISRTERSGHVQFFLASDALSRALVQMGRRDEAIRTLERAGRQQLKTYPLIGLGGAFTGFAWIRSQAALVGLYHDAGREPDETRLRARLLRLLVAADADHPILRELEASAAAHRQR